MSKIRVHELAKKLRRQNRDLIAALEDMGIEGKTHSSGIDEDVADRLTRIFESIPEDDENEKPAPKKSSVARAALEEVRAALERKMGPLEETPEPEKPVKKIEEAPAPRAAEPRAVESRTAEPRTAEPRTAEPRAVEPRAVESRTAEPRVAATKAPPVAPAAPVEEPVIEEEVQAAAVAPVAPPADKTKKKELRAAKALEKKKDRKRREKKGGFSTMIKDAMIPPPDLKESELLPDEVNVLKVPERYRQAIDTDKGPKFKSKPGMQKAFQAIRKIDQSKRPQPGLPMPGKKKGRGREMERVEKVLPAGTAPRKKTLKIHEGATIKEFAELVAMKSSDIIKEFMKLGYMPNINQPLDMDAALLVAEALGVKLDVESVEDATVVEEIRDDESLLVHRPPIVTIMGHVDHGKTSLLDAIRETKVIDTEAGGITQHIGAYKVSLKGKEIVFLDTPGHEAFTALRARGASVTDIVILTVAADDGVKPQTVEAIDHAKAAGVPIIVAVNKIDKPEANPDKVRQELSEYGIISEDWGGQNIFAEISAKKRIGIENLLELILLQAEVLELKANPNRMANGVIIESRVDKGRGPVATVLVQGGTLNIGDVFISGVNTGRVRAIFDDMGKKIKRAVPSTPVEIIGFNELPNSGDVFMVMEDEKKARQVALARLNKLKSSAVGKKSKLTLDDLYSKIKEGNIKDLNIIIKGDVQGSVEAIKEALENITHPEVKVKVIHSTAGGINESDVMLATASDAIIIGFNVRPETKAAQLAEREGVDIELYNVIYEAIDDVKKALEGMLAPTFKEKVLGRAEVRNTFMVSRLGTIAGCMVIDGMVSRTCDGVRVIRDNIVIYQGRLGSLKRFKEDAKEVQSGYECGIMIENFNDIKVGDVVENFILEKFAGKL